jgi:hypothetical protein
MPLPCRYCSVLLPGCCSSPELWPWTKVAVIVGADGLLSDKQHPGSVLSRVGKWPHSHVRTTADEGNAVLQCYPVLSWIDTSKN